MGMPGLFTKNYEKDIYTRDEFVFFDKKLLAPAPVCGAFNSIRFVESMTEKETYDVTTIISNKSANAIISTPKAFM